MARKPCLTSMASCNRGCKQVQLSVPRWECQAFSAGISHTAARIFCRTAGPEDQQLLSGPPLQPAGHPCWDASVSVSPWRVTLPLTSIAGQAEAFVGAPWAHAGHQPPSWHQRLLRRLHSSGFWKAECGAQGSPAAASGGLTLQALCHLKSKRVCV